jgi:glycosyltransferase 2 family protein
LENSSEIKSSISTKRLTWSWSWWQVKILIAAVLVYYLFSSGKLSLDLFHYVFSFGSLLNIIIAGLLLIFAYYLAAWRIFFLFKAQGLLYPQKLCFQISLIGFFFNNFLPASIGGDAMRAYYFARGRRQNLAPILATLVYDRVLGLMALVLLAFGGLSLAWLVDQGFVWTREFRWALAGLAGALSIFFLSFLLSRWPRFMGLLESLLARIPWGGAAILHFFASIANLSKFGLLSLALVGISLGLQISAVLALYFTGLAFGLDPHFWLTIILSPLILLSGILPLAPNNIGWTEYLGSLIWASQGIGQGGNLWMAYRLVTAFFSLSGLIVYLRLRAGAITHES